MGRAKLNMELISKEKSRYITFKKRKEGLKRKMYEFTTLCDVEACMIVYGPKQENSSFEPDIWPENDDKMRRIIDIYKKKSKDSGTKTFGLSDFFHDRKKKIEEELLKLRRKNMEARYPKSIDFLNGSTEVQLRELAAYLSVKLEDATSRVNNLRRSREVLDMSFMDIGRMNPSQGQGFYSPTGTIQRGNFEFGVINQQAVSSIKRMHCSALDHNNQEMHSLNQNAMMMLLLNDNDHCVQFGGASTSGNISFKHQVFYDYESKGVDPMMGYSPMPLARFYTPPVAPAPYVMSGVLPMQIPAGMPPLPQLPDFSKES